MTTKTAPAAQVRSGRPWGLLGLLAVLVVAALAVVAYLAFTGDSNPTVTFDGQTAIYDGPDSFDAGDYTFVFDASDYEHNAALIVLRVTDPTATEAELKASIETGAENDLFDPFQSDLIWVTDENAEDRIREETIDLDADVRYTLIINPREVDVPDVYVTTFEVD